MFFSDDFIQKVREQNNIVEIISEHTNLTRKGQSYWGICPFHNEKTPSFSVREDKQMYYCFGCGAGGNLITFLMEKENLSFPESIVNLAERKNISLEYGENIKPNKKNDIFEIYKMAARFYYFTLKQSKNEKIMKYLEDRGLNREIIKNFGIGYAPPDYNILYRYFKEQGYEDEILVKSGLCQQKTTRIYDRFSNRIMFPIFNPLKKVIAFGGRVIGEGQPKYLNSPETSIFDKSKVLYGLNWARANKHDYYILVEGYMDVIAMHKSGFTQTVASLGTAFTASQAKLLKRYTSKVIIFYDNDVAGCNATLRAIPILRKEEIEVKVLQLEQAKDPDEFIRKHGTEKLQQQLDEAKTDVWFQIEKLQQKYDLNIPEQKIKFLKFVAQIIGNISSTIEQAVYINEIIKIYNIDKNSLEAEIRRIFKNSLEAQAQQNFRDSIELTNKVYSNNKYKVSKPNIFIELLATLYHYRFIYAFISPYINKDLFEEGIYKELFICITNNIENGEEINIDYFVNCYKDIESQKIVSKVLMYEDERYKDINKLNKMINDVVKKINYEDIAKKQKTINNPLEQINLLEYKKVIDRLYIDITNG
ncbi:DNA primase [Candidatus Epulonipiscium fishelsonii]|uniref:DNA primase n=1 Tax=Candidatus Epulonipiscium fishelsonii TaxID=77094 RepID=A0ACC8XAH0_9FIRM|nr:DNA primase [Epulopiscium sp. SCG-B11WGA-EpuloA1]